MTLIATLRFTGAVCSASHTAPIPPSPSFVSRRYGPIEPRLRSAVCEDVSADCSVGSRSGGVWRFNVFGEADLTPSFISGLSIQDYHRAQIDCLIQPVRPPSPVSVLVSVCFGVRCALLRSGALWSDG